MEKVLGASSGHSEEYDEADFFVDISSFDRERKAGVSGLLRVYNEGWSVGACIDSCVEALDELIICYQPSDDDTELVLKERQKQYPDKIKLFLYKPHMYAHKMSHSEYEYACTLPQDSIHLLSNYYNYTLSKASYTHAMKIDADQLYFGERLKMLCDACRNRKLKPRRTLLYLVMRFCHKYVLLKHNWLKTPLAKAISSVCLMGRPLVDVYMKSLCKVLSSRDCVVSFSGINLCRDGDGVGVRCHKHPGDLACIFNGVGDTLLFAVSSKSHYVPYYSANYGTPESRSLVEKFVFDRSPKFWAPLLWYHLRYMRKSANDDFGVTALAYDKFRSSSYAELSRQGLFWAPQPCINLYKGLYTYDRDYPHYSEFKILCRAPEPSR